MEHNPTHITHDFPPFFRLHKSGHVERYQEHDFVPPSHHRETGGVASKDVVISPENHVSARIFLPKTTAGHRKLPLIVYVHGGGFSVGSAFSSLYHNYVESLAAESKSVVVSVDYRLAPEHPIPACYDDTFTVLKWVDSQSRAGNGPDPWLKEHADFGRVYMAGDSAGGNIIHNMAIRANDTESRAGHGLGFKISGLILIHPFFGIGQPDKVWDHICPGPTGADDVRLNPTADMKLLSKLGCERVLVCVGKEDFLRERGCHYYEGLKKCDWNGVVDLFETPGEHVFHLFDYTCDGAVSLMKRIVGFINSQDHVVSSHVF